MVKELLKNFFSTGETIYTGFPMPHLLLPEKLIPLYADYYRDGSGGILFSVIFGISLYLSIFASGIERYIARFFILFVSITYISESKQIVTTEVFFTPFFIPALKMPLYFLYSLLLISGIINFISFRNRLQLYVGRGILRFFDCTCLFLLLCTALPIYSGELWH